ncbi:hypothetical protein G6L30_17105 [Agrobacterium rhizogenes]|nr:hypothetical protein [Rhizobium rhizogenes]
MTQTAKELSAQITKAMEAVTPGPWAYQRPDTYVKGHMGTANVRVVAQMDESRRGLTNWQADLGYIAAVQPNNMRVILSALADAELQLSADSRIAELEQQIANIKASRDLQVTIAAGEEERARKAEAERDELRAKLFPYADATEISGISWDGKYLIGDKASIRYFHEMQNRGLQIDVYQRAYEEGLASAKALATAAEVKLAEAVKVMADLVNGLVTDDEEGLIEHVPQIVAARALLSKLEASSNAV